MNESRFLGPTERMLYFSTLPTVQDLDPTTTMAVAEYTTELQVDAGYVFLHPNTPPSHVYFLVSGEVEITVNQISQKRAAPWTIGLEMLLGQGLLQQRAVATTDCITLSIPTSVVLDLLAFDPTVKGSLLRQYARRRLEQCGGFPVLHALPDLDPQPGEPDLLERMRLLRHSTPGRLNFDGALLLLHHLSYAELEPGEVISAPHTPPRYVILLEGAVCFTQEGESQTIDGPADFGLAQILSDHPVTIKTVISSPSRVLIAGPDSIHSALEHGPGLSQSLLQDLVTESMDVLNTSGDH